MAVTESLAEEAHGPAGAVHEGILRRQSARESSARTYARTLPIVPVRARGLTIEGADGRRYLDCLSGAGTLALGHNHPVVLAAVRQVLDSGAPLSVLDLATPVKDAFITELFRTLPPGLAGRARVQFCGPAGTDAVEAALKLVRTATGRSGVLAFTGAYHGMTAGALAVSGGAPEVQAARLPYPQDYRCPFGVGGPRGAELAARCTESLLDDPKSGVPLPAGMILEPVQGEGGVLPAPDDWLRRMRRLTADRAIPLIADEVQTGVGRTGAFWAVDHSGITPDVMVLSKAIGGSLPLAVIVYRDDLDVWQPGAHAGTFRGNQLAMAAGTATLAYVRENGLAERAGRLGARVMEQLRADIGGLACVGEVRGRGLMIGVELVEPEGTQEPAFGAGSAAVGRGGAEFLDHRFTAGPSGDGAHGAYDPSAAASGMEPGAYDFGAGPSGGKRVAHDFGAAPSGGGLGTYDSGAVPSGGERGAYEPGAASFEMRPGAYDFATAPARTPRPAAPRLAAAVQRECLRRGLIVELGGRHSSVVRLLPPLTISDEQTAAVLDRLTDAVAAVARDEERHGPQGARGHDSDPCPGPGTD
ncbi:diaminobutyrate--2-oxoglutarate transaminase family protein [Streptomyces sp. CRPSP2-6A1]|uniref:diaminobutyrate--2-oxoglutarate transaminase family protein n=1 Tax=Streptomyces sp. CRPSP2-6A1 TaxID=2799588 RepID=UPI0027DBA427|nr:diaminobutyrate--2-oxoglutarate transaminase family protein [Streptomyces sp. CRPSP2-6A1]